MTSNTVVRARIDERLKKEAEAVLASIGLTVSDAFRLMMVRIATERGFRSSRSFPMTRPLRP
jgi:DNA-damage-inducible protein J